MTTPIFDFLKNYANQNKTRCHMPGHKGFSNKTPSFYDDTPFKEIAKYDITEIQGADELFFANSIIAASEENTSLLYNSAHTSFSAGGSTLCIQAMVSLVASENSNIICARNVHASFINICGLLNINPIFIEQQFFDESLVSSNISPENVEKAITNNPTAVAVYITSPDYLGVISDIKSISDVCKKYNIPLLVDNAHGAHLKFLQEDIHPLTLGASMCCDSPHKTLPVLTGGAFLHIAKGFHITKEQVKEKMSIFGSTSPSYLIMMSIDLNNKYLHEKARSDFFEFEKNIDSIKDIAVKKGFIFKKGDITKFTLNAQDVGLTGVELATIFRSYDIEPEYVALYHVVLMLSPFNSQTDFARVKKSLNSIKVAIKKSKEFALNVKKCTPLCLPTQKTAIRKAMFSNKILLPIDECVGKVSAQVVAKCPPGVPIIIPGELIDKNIIKVLKKTSIILIYVLQ